MVVFRRKLQFLIASIPEATRQVIIIVCQNPCILHPGEYTVGTLKAKNLTPPPPTPYPKKKKNHDREMVEPRPLDPETCRDGHNLRHYSRHWTRLFSHDQRYEKKKLFTTKNATIRYNYWKGFKKNLKKYFNVEVSSCKPGHDKTFSPTFYHKGWSSNVRKRKIKDDRELHSFAITSNFANRNGTWNRHHFW